jgi:dUTP pyrophosphatase
MIFHKDKKESPITMQYYKTDPCVPSPAYKTKAAACFDLHVSFKNILKVSTPLRNVTINTSNDNTRYVMLFPNERYIVGTGMIFDIPEGYMLNVNIRSGSAFTCGLSLHNSTGKIDEDYTDEVGLILSVTQPTKLVEYSRIAQAEIRKYTQTELIEAEIPPAMKGNRLGGFGSTGG